MRCSELHIFDDSRIPVFQCRNEASIIATEYKHGTSRGICSHCFYVLTEDGGESFLDLNKIEEIED